MKAEARRYFWWPSIDKEIEDLSRQCQSCTQNDKQPIKVPSKQWNVPDKPWQRIHIDFMGKFMGSYFLIVVDAHSKWLEVFMMNDISTTSTIKILTSLFARYGLCEEIVSDNGTQFTSEEFVRFCVRNGIKHIRTTPAHPQSNGQAERYVKTVKTALRKGLYRGGNLSDILLKFLFCYRTTPHSTTNASPAELFLKRQLRTVLDLLRPNATGASHVTRTRYQVNFDRHTKERQFHQNDKVIVRDFRHNPNKIEWTPGVLISRQGSRIWNVQVENNVWRRHENQIKIRHWSFDQPVILTNQTETSTPTSDNQNHSLSSSPQKESQVIRQSSRPRSINLCRTRPFNHNLRPFGMYRITVVLHRAINDRIRSDTEISDHFTAVSNRLRQGK
ncbi:unnamed protein product [Rotaria magnacalcarata]|nr:unnamed protein product [Rotaria magnacalcarata]CAF4208669.1 unnamed protein product [Rotaria magnacalcarata]